MKSKRLDYIDTAKGILILLMVYGHVFLSGLPRQWLYTFHMPAFFIITGLLMNHSSSLDKPILSFLRSRVMSFIIPLFFFEAIGVFTDIVRYGFKLNIFGYAYNTISGNFNNGPNWFLFATFVAEMILLILHKTIRSKYPTIAFAVLIAILLVCNHDIFPNAGQTGVALMFILFGYHAKHFFEICGKRATAISLAISILITVINGSVDISELCFGFIPFYAVGATVGTLLILSISKYISSSSLQYWGNNSLIVMGTHQAILLPIRRYANLPVFPIHIGILVYFGILLLEIPVIYFLTKYVPFLVGKKRP